jgi:hypothetical protein
LDATLIRQVWERAKNRCEYCHLRQDQSDITFEIDHIIARKHQGPTIASNLSLSCFRCNSFKGVDLSGLDRQTGKLTPLFHPRRHKWTRHFRWEGPYLVGQTPIGRVTISVLKINHPFRVELRSALIDEGIFSQE